MMACHVVPPYGELPTLRTLCGTSVPDLPEGDTVIELPNPERDQLADCPACLMAVANVVETDEPRRDWGLGEALVSIPELQAQIDQLKEQVSILTMTLTGCLVTLSSVSEQKFLGFDVCKAAYRKDQRVIPVAVPIGDKDFRFEVKVDPPPPPGEPERKSAWERISENDD